MLLWRDSIDLCREKIGVAGFQEFRNFFIVSSRQVSDFGLFEIEGNCLSIIGILWFKNKLKLRSDFKLIKDKNSLSKRETSDVAMKKMKIFHEKINSI